MDGTLTEQRKLMVQTSAFLSQPSHTHSIQDTSLQIIQQLFQWMNGHTVKMYYAILDGETVKRSGTLNTLFPNASFPLSGPNDEFKEENDLVEVLEYLEHDSETQKMIFCDPYLLDGSVYRVELVDFTSEELESNLAGIEEFESLQGE